MSAATRSRILAVGEQLGYTPNRVAASLAGRGGDTVGLFLQDLRNDVFADVYDGVVQTVEASGRHVVLAIGRDDGSRDRAGITALLQGRVDVIVAAGLQLPDSEVAVAIGSTPMVSVARAIPGVDSVVSDNRAGASSATRHLIDLGHRRIAFLANPPSDGYLDRVEGYREVMGGEGLVPDVVVSSYSRERAAVDAGAVLDAEHPPTAIFAHNDQAALGVLDALELRGLRAPHDVSVVGYDDTRSSRMPGIGLTTVDIRAAVLGREAGALAIARIDAGSSTPGTVRRSSPTLMVRDTTGPPPR